MSSCEITEKLLQTYPLKLLEMVCGKLLGDGNLSIEEKRSPRLRFAHANKDKEWCIHCYNELRDYLSLATPKYRRLEDKRLDFGYSEQYYVQSKTNVFYHLMKQLWYVGRKKVLPINFLKAVMSPLCLAWWYLDDGHLKCKKDKPQKIILSTESFSLAELIELQILIHNTFSLKFLIDGQRRLILYDSASILLFLRIIRPYLVPSMTRKDVNSKQLNIEDLPEKHRTSIYLPRFFNFIKPTAEIKEILTEYPLVESKINQIQNLQRYIQLARTSNRVCSSYQITLTRVDLFHLKQMSTSTGFTKGECIEYIYLLKNGHL